MLVGMWMTREVVTIAPEASISTAAVEMSRRRVRRLVVTSPGPDGPQVRGVVSSHDIARVCPSDLNPRAVIEWPEADDRRVSSVMSRRVTTTTADAPIEDAARLLRVRKIGALPVVRGARLVGIITQSDIFDAFLELTGVHDGGVRITFDLGDDESLVAAVTAMVARYDVRLTSVFALRHEVGNAHRLGVVRLVGPDADRVVDAVWRSGHRVLSVLRSGPDSRR